MPNRRIFFQTTCLSLFNIILNVTLKGIFKVPLAMSLGKIGYAFPSGHMQLSSVFYLWLALQIKSWPLRISIAILLIGIALGLIHFDYHNVQDVSAGLVTAILLIICFHWALSQCRSYLPALFISLSSILMLCNYFIYITPPIHASVAYLCLIIILLIAILSTNKYKIKTF